ncbi:MAG: MBG domain-containing protein [Bacteroidota bacterium]
MRGDSYDSDDAPSAAGTYTVTATFAGNDTYSSGTDNEPLAIGKAAVTITAKSQTKQYGDTFIFTGEPDEFTVEGLEPGDAVTSATLNSAGAPASALANGSPYSIAISNAIGTGLDNYDIQYVPGQLIVNYIPITDVHLAQGVAILCNGGVTTLTVSVTGGDLPLQYKLDDGDYQLGNTFNGVHAGTHTVYVKDADGYTASNSIIITEPDALSATISSQVNAGCGGGTTGSATVGVTGGTAGYTYEWNDDSHQAGATATNLAPGTYIVTVKDANGCTTTATVTITTLAAPVSLGDKTECYSAQTLTAEATAPSGLNVRWYDAPSGGNVIESPTRSSVGTVTYYAASVNEDGCESIQRTAVALTIKALPPAPSSSNTNVQDCYNGNPSQTLTASAAVNGGTVTWYTLASGGSIVENPVQVGVGTVTYYAESVVDGCTSASRTAVSLTIYPAATVLETLPPVITTANDGCTRDYISFTPPTTLSTYCSIPATGVRLNALGQIDLVNTLSSPFPVGTTTIRWEANVNGQLLTSIQQVIVEDKTAPVPNVASLAAVTGQCSAIVTVVADSNG